MATIKLGWRFRFIFSTHCNRLSWKLGKNKFVMWAFTAIEYRAARSCRNNFDTMNICSFSRRTKISVTEWLHWNSGEVWVKRQGYSPNAHLYSKSEYFLSFFSVSFVVLNATFTRNNLLCALLTCAPSSVARHHSSFWQLRLKTVQIWILKPELLLVHKIPHFNCKMWVKFHSYRFFWG